MTFSSAQLLYPTTILPPYLIVALWFRLPTSDEWSFACRAGAAGAWGWVRPGEPGVCKDMAWTKENALGLSHPVKTRRPNAWDIYDMHGNVWELVSDALNGEYLVLGGSYAEPERFCAADSFQAVAGDARNRNVGFRVAAVEF